MDYDTMTVQELVSAASNITSKPIYKRSHKLTQVSSHTPANVTPKQVKLYTDEQVEALEEHIACIDLLDADERAIRDYERSTARLVKAMRARLAAR